MIDERDERTSDTAEREGSRLRNFIRKRVPDSLDAEDVLQEVFLELVEANRLLMPIEHVTAWLYRVARNRIVDFARRKKPERGGEGAGETETIADLIPSPAAGPEAVQREVFVEHELEGRSFKEIAAATGVNVNTLLSRKRAAVRRLREQLRDVYDELKNG